MILKEQTGYWNLDGGLLLFWRKKKGFNYALSL